MLFLKTSDTYFKIGTKNIKRVLKEVNYSLNLLIMDILSIKMKVTFTNTTPVIRRINEKIQMTLKSLVAIPPQ